MSIRILILYQSRVYSTLIEYKNAYAHTFTHPKSQAIFSPPCTHRTRRVGESAFYTHALHLSYSWGMRARLRSTHPDPNARPRPPPHTEQGRGGSAHRGAQVHPALSARRAQSRSPPARTCTRASTRIRTRIRPGSECKSVSK